jgi:DNA repair photolyase
MHDPRPHAAIEFEPRFCANHVADLTAGCSFGCVYCPFAEIRAERLGVARPTPVDVSRVAELPAPPTIFLSPASDPFAPQAAARTHRLLEHLLPRGTVVGILTKGVVPDETLRLLAAHRRQVEGLVVGLTSLDDRRNRALEPGCPPAAARLETLARAAAAGLPAALRLDPLFPDVDDAPAQLDALVAAAAARGARSITATYVFAWGRVLRRLRREPVTAAAAAQLTERAPMEGGTAFSVPLGRKLATYAHLAAAARARGVGFSTCGCKDLRIAPRADFQTTCRNAANLADAGLPTRCGARPAPAAAAPSAPPALPR